MSHMEARTVLVCRNERIRWGYTGPNEGGGAIYITAKNTFYYVVPYFFMAVQML